MNNPKMIWVKAILIAVGVMGLYLFVTTRTTLWDRDEPRFARATVEMIQSGNYLVPTFNGQLWADKPILTYWAQSLAVRAFGPTAFACRFFSTVGAGLTCFFIFLIGKRLVDSKTALWAMVILSTSVLMFAIGTMATADGVTMPFIIGAIAVFVYAPNSGMRIYQIFLLGVTLGMGMLAKGPIGLLPVPAIACFLWLRRRDLRIGRFIWQMAAALIIGLLVFMAWAVPADIATGGKFLRVFIGHHVIERALKPLEHHGGSTILYLFYYFPVVIVGFFPWILYLPGAISAIWGGRIGAQKGKSLLLGWIVPVFVIMSLAATKLPHYILFIWPGLALAVAGVITAAKQDRLTETDKIWLRRGVWFFGPPALCVAAAFLIAPFFIHVRSLYIGGIACGIVLAVMAVSACVFQQRNKFSASAKTILIGTILFEILLSCGVFGGFEQIKIPPFIARDVRTKTTSDVPVATYKFDEPSLNFYIGRKINHIRKAESVIGWIRQQETGVLIAPAKTITNIQKDANSLPELKEISSKRGYNYSKGKVVEVQAVLFGKGNTK